MGECVEYKFTVTHRNNMDSNFVRFFNKNISFIGDSTMCAVFDIYMYVLLTENY